jgi:WD40 repeat protein
MRKRTWSVAGALLAIAVVASSRALRPADAADPPTLRPAAVWDSFDDSSELSLSGDGSVLLVGSPSSGMTFLDAANGKKQRSVEADESARLEEARFAGAARRVLVRSTQYGDEKLPVLINASTGAKRATFERPAQRTPQPRKPEVKFELAIPPAGNAVFAVWDSDPYVDVHDLDSGKIVRSVSFAPAAPAAGKPPEFVSVRNIAASADGRYLSVAVPRADDVRLCLCEFKKTASGTESRSWVDPPKDAWGRVFRTVALSDDGSRLVTRASKGDKDSEFLVWDTSTGKVAWTLPENDVRACSTRGAVAAIVGDKTITVRDVATGRVLRVLEFEALDVYPSVVLSAGAERAYVGLRGQRVAMWDLKAADARK